MKLILADKQELKCDSVVLSTLREGALEKESIEIRIYECEKSGQELRSILTDEQLATFDVEMDNGFKQTFTGWQFFRAMLTMSENAVFTSVTLYHTDDVAEMTSLSSK